MTIVQNYTLDALKRSHHYITQNALTPPNPIATAAATALGNSITLIETLHGDRLNGNGTWRGAAAERRSLLGQIRGIVGNLSRVAKTLDKTAHPDVAAQLKMGRLGSYASMIALTNNAITVVTPITTVFTERGAPATIIADLETLLASLLAAGNRSSGGRGKRIGKRVEMANAIREGMDQVRILDGVLNFALKSTPGLLAEWRAAKRVQRRHYEPAEETPGGGGGGSGSTPPSGS